ncbi:MAG: type II secretion system protein [Elusimicrobia bacterium]|nr:type II secretion system protein [Elusimicrobiota bacterium]
MKKINIRKKQNTGFSLVELVVTLVIVITLSLISFPIYRGRTHNTSKLAEGYALLGVIIDAQISYYNEYGNFLSSADASAHNDTYTPYTCNDTVLGINALNNRYFTYFSVNANPNRGAYGGTRPESKYHFTAAVRSASSGTISIEYNITQRFEPITSGV